MSDAEWKAGCDLEARQMQSQVMIREEIDAWYERADRGECGMPSGHDVAAALCLGTALTLAVGPSS